MAKKSNPSVRRASSSKTGSTISPRSQGKTAVDDAPAGNGDAMKNTAKASQEETVQPEDHQNDPIKTLSSTGNVTVLTSLPKEFVFSAKRAAGQVGLQMLANADNLVRDLKSFSGLDIEIVEIRQPKRNLGLMTFSNASPSKSALLVRMDEEKGKLFAQQSLSPSSALWVEENHKIQCFDDPLSQHFSTTELLILSDGGPSSRVDLQVFGDGEKPLSRAVVKIYSALQLEPTIALTNEDGVASFQFPNALLNSIAGIVVEPYLNHWGKVIRNPQIIAEKVNAVRVRSFSEFDPKFSKKGAVSWGVEGLRVLGREAIDGRGIKIGIIDTGCDTSHLLLSHVKKGIDFNPGATEDSWKKDEIGHGTHVAGIVGARFMDKDFTARGMAPQAEIYVYKVFPKGDMFVLGSAIQAAVDDGVDIINMSLGSKDLSNDVAENISIARDAGITCFVAAGNSGDGVQFPASLSTVMAVSALGYAPAIPEDSLSANTFVPAGPMTNGYFSPAFTCFGLSIDFSGPGVGVISTVPNGFKALDGTSMAAPHIAGLAALYLAHDSGLKNLPRTSARSDLLFDRLKQSTYKLPFASDRVGFGMPLADNFSNPNPVFTASMSSSDASGPMAIAGMQALLMGRIFAGGGATGAW